MGMWASEVPPNCRLENYGFSVWLLPEVWVWTALHPVNPPKGRCALNDDTPGFVEVRVIIGGCGHGPWRKGWRCWTWLLRGVLVCGGGRPNGLEGIGA